MSNMLFKTNRNLFVRYHNFNLPRKVDIYKKIVNILNFRKTVQPKWPLIFFSCCFFLLLKFAALPLPTVPRGVFLSVHYQRYWSV